MGYRLQKIYFTESLNEEREMPEETLGEYINEVSACTGNTLSLCLIHPSHQKVESILSSSFIEYAFGSYIKTNTIHPWVENDLTLNDR